MMATYEYVSQSEHDARPWVGPQIYDQDGELVWSGAPTFKGYNIKDFKMSKVNGVDMLSGVWTHDHVEMLMDNNYKIYKKLHAAQDPGVSLNIHGFNTVDNGTLALAMILRQGAASKEESARVGFDGKCRVTFPGFEVYNTTTWERIFYWDAEDKIHLDEVYVPSNCKGRWDYLSVMACAESFEIC